MIEPLTAAAVRDLRLPWLSRFSPQSLSSHLTAHDGLSLWVPHTGEYVVAEQWRHRSDIACILEVTARKGREPLLTALLEVLKDRGFALVIMMDEVWSDQPRVFESLGFHFIEKIVFLERDLRSRQAMVVPQPLPALEFARATTADLDLLEQLDHASFPWLWWNSRGEFELYLQTDDVWAYIARQAGVAVGYASFTRYEGWAHLDRLAVPGPYQGRRLGAAQLHHVLLAVSALSAGWISLSTQENNAQSHRLYAGFGFAKTRNSMNLYGKQLAEPVK